ncbi:MAG: hypothetical protein FJX57_16380 [Alphaproteobacteria bacterium]|nr:hypothetical protein [Alphaproteobacteria bacterium]
MELAEEADVETKRDGERVQVARWTMDVKPARTYQQFGKYRGNVDRWQISDFAPPSFFTINNGSAEAGSGAREGRGRGTWFFNVCHGITPATATTTNYFWAIAHPNWTENGDEIEEFHRQCRHVIGEDVAVFEVQQACIDRDPDAPTVDIKYDTGPLLARRIVADLLKKEARATAKKRPARRRIAAE